MSSTDQAWEKWGQIDPYFGVLTEEKYRKDNLYASRAEFFATGVETVEKVVRRYEQMFGPLPRDRVLDFGCGVGRISLAFASEFKEVVGLDISPSMLAEASKNAENANISNAHFFRSDDTLSKAGGLFDFVFTYVVMQHIPVDRGVPIIRTLLDKVRPGGGFHIHFSVRDDGAIKSLARWAKNNVPLAGALANLARGRAAAEPAMQMNAYPLISLTNELHSRGISDIRLSSEKHGAVLTVALMGKKPG